MTASGRLPRVGEFCEVDFSSQLTAKDAKGAKKCRKNGRSPLELLVVCPSDSICEAGV